MKKIPVIVIVGPTASGKTALSIEIAKRIDGEIVSFDSMQVYKELSISTAKPTLDEMDGVKHHLIDCISVLDEFSVADFVKEAKKIVCDIVSRGKTPVFVGGTGLYIDSFINNIDFSCDNKNAQIREKLDKEEKELGAMGLYEVLCKLDGQAAKEIHPNNVKRVKRALEMYYTTGESKTEQVKRSKEAPSIYDPLFIGINYVNREKLYERINLRVDMMLENGILDEVKAFYKLPVSKTAIQAIGCKEFKPFIDGELLLDVCVEKLKQETRRYAKRQITWFKRNDKINWFYPDEDTSEEIVSKSCLLVEDFLRKRGVANEQQC
ncbi:MAG: tRNA (adenosine(37)-N6)-dimethylallyltransferase MiaA [Clostridia bacterium]|nr:tRNA (adenosine(37)-N6)-dimethylallyltransferase MiaA [Clostridia bacterium]